MKDFSNATKVGLIIMLIAGIIMAFLVVISKQVPNLVAWLFFTGLIISVTNTYKDDIMKYLEDNNVDVKIVK